MATTSSWHVVQILLNEQKFGVLGTIRNGHAYASLVAFAVSADCRHLYFATTQSTRKYDNLSLHDETSLLIDNRANYSHALFEAAAVTAYGQANAVPEAKREEVLSLYLEKHPQLKSFVSSPTTALFQIVVDTYHLVQRFQQVTEFRISE